MAKVSGVSIEESIRRITSRRAGLDRGRRCGDASGRPRRAIAPLKESGERWLEVMTQAHRLGVSSTATMMMGTGETNAERIDHLRMIRDVQDKAVAGGYTGSFRSFIPWTYQPENNHLQGRTQATSLEYLRLVAVARLFFDNIAHLQSSWLTTGKDVGQVSLHLGVDDLGSIMLEENVISSAGARHRSRLTELVQMIRDADRIPAQRDTRYRRLRVHWTPADGPERRPGAVALLVDRPARRRHRPLPAADPGDLVSRATLDKEPHEVAAMFDGVARRYDLTNTVISGGRTASGGVRPAWRWA
jgi:cyclic dehypoxanthinyl futalosine synthase